MGPEGAPGPPLQPPFMAKAHGTRHSCPRVWGRGGDARHSASPEAQALPSAGQVGGCSRGPRLTLSSSGTGNDPLTARQGRAGTGRGRSPAQAGAGRPGMGSQEPVPTLELPLSQVPTASHRLLCALLGPQPSSLGLAPKEAPQHTPAHSSPLPRALLTCSTAKPCPPGGTVALPGDWVTGGPPT